MVGSFYDEFTAKSESMLGATWDPGTAVFQ
jgi:hypothetical protein